MAQSGHKSDLRCVLSFQRNFSTSGRVHLSILVFRGGQNMDEDRIAGTARKLGGKVQEEVGRFSGDTETQIKGMADQAAGTAQDLYGQAADAARDTAAPFDKWLRKTIKTTPKTPTI